MRGRIALWSTTTTMIAERPFLGWGPSGFGRAYASFQTPAEVDPRGRVEAVDDPHNLVLSAAVTTGLVGAFALMAAAALLGRAVIVRRSEPGAAALGAALAAAFVALQFHFVTLDSGVAVSLLVGAVVGLGLEAPDAGEGVRWPWYCGAVGLLLATIVSAGLVAADARVGAGFSAASAGDVPRAIEAFDSARMLAAWEPAIDWAAGRAMTSAASSDRVAAAYGTAALERATRRMSGDSRPLATSVTCS